MQSIKNKVHKPKPVQLYTARFYNNGLRVAIPEIVMEASNREDARALVKHLINTKSRLVPKQYDDWVLN